MNEQLGEGYEMEWRKQVAELKRANDDLARAAIVPDGKVVVEKLEWDGALDLLAEMFDAYEEGYECYEDPEDCSGFLGQAVNLSTYTKDRIISLLSKHRPKQGKTK